MFKEDRGPANTLRTKDNPALVGSSLILIGRAVAMFVDQPGAIQREMKGKVRALIPGTSGSCPDSIVGTSQGGIPYREEAASFSVVRRYCLLFG